MVLGPQHVRRPRILPLAVALTALGVALGWGQAPARAQEAGEKDGLFITVPTPINDAAVQQIRSKVENAVTQGRKNLRTVVFDFNPNGAPASTTTFGSCGDLAEYIRNLQLGQVKADYPRLETHAFVHNEVSRHTVLPVLACGHLIMSEEYDTKKNAYKARLGDILGEGERLSVTARTAYEAVAKGHPSPDLVRKLIEGELLHSTIDAVKARKIGLCEALYNKRADVAQALRLPRHALAEDWLGGRTAVAVRIEVRGPLNKGKYESLERHVKNALSRRANLIILHLEAEEGDTQDGPSKANWLRNLHEETGGLPVKTVAWIPPGRSLGAATFLALGCQEIVMAKDAVLGDFDYLLRERADALPDVKANLVDLAREQGYPEKLFEAMADPDLVLYRARSKTNPNEFRLVSDKQLEEDARSKEPKWHNLGRIDKPDGKLLKVDARMAREWSVAQFTDIDTPEALYALYNLDPAKVERKRDDWLDGVAQFFTEPAVKVLLIMLGIVGLILELKIPGTGLPGVLAAICFVLFFWAHSFTSQFTMLAVLLFVLGLILIAIEVFVLPGFGVTGISGIVLVVGSMVLVTLERMPQTTQDWVSLGGTLMTFGLSLVGAIALAFVLAWYLPNIPYANRLVLKPPEEEGAETDPFAARSETFAALLGAIGVAATPLRPAGKARFGDDFLDVMAEGDYVLPGARVQVIEIEGNRIIVKEV
jgi:membrane-bound serine protease (ClpP class)